MKDIYRKCSELPLYNFIKLIVTNDISWLNIDKDSDVSDEHTQVWNDIIHEYMSLTKNTKQLYVLDLLKIITAANLNLDLIQRIITFMANDYDADLVKILRSFGFMFKYDPYSETYEKDLEMTVSSAKSIIIKKKIAEEELNKLNSEPTDSRVASEQDYIALIVAMGRFQGYRIDWKETTVSEYAEILRVFTKQAEENGK